MLTGIWLRKRLIEPLEEKQREEAKRQRAEARAAGRAKAFEEIREWEARRKDAEARGEPFDEPLPYLNSSSSNGHAS